MNRPIDQQMNEIKIPDALHTRCAMGAMQAKHEMEDHRMKQFRGKKLAAVAVALVLCVGVLAGTALADSLEGFFRDIYRGTAVVGTEYANATAEVCITADGAVLAQDGNVHLTIGIEFDNITEAPFKYLEEVTMGDYVIRDENGKNMIRVTNSDGSGTSVAVYDGQAVFDLAVSAERLAQGSSYTLEVESIYGLAKADAPLLISGQWSCEFTVQ